VVRTRDVAGGPFLVGADVEQHRTSGDHPRTGVDVDVAGLTDHAYVLLGCQLGWRAGLASWVVSWVGELRHVGLRGLVSAVTPRYGATPPRLAVSGGARRQSSPSLAGSARRTPIRTRIHRRARRRATSPTRRWFPPPAARSRWAFGPRPTTRRARSTSR